MFHKRFKSDYVSLFTKTEQQKMPSGYPCSFNEDCQSPGVCQFNVCTVNIGGNEISDLSNVCRGMSIKDCAKEMQKEREQTEVPIFIPNFPSNSYNDSTGGNGSSNVPSINLCKYDKECSNNQVCISNLCLDKSNFPLIARQKRLKMQQQLQNKEFDVKKFFQHKKTPLDGTLSPYEYMFLFENIDAYGRSKNTLIDNENIHDDYFYFSNK
jgi:hypothetical protein